MGSGNGSGRHGRKDSGLTGGWDGGSGKDREGDGGREREKEREREREWERMQQLGQYPAYGHSRQDWDHGYGPGPSNGHAHPHAHGHSSSHGHGHGRGYRNGQGNGNGSSSPVWGSPPSMSYAHARANASGSGSASASGSGSGSSMYPTQPQGNANNMSSYGSVNSSTIPANSYHPNHNHAQYANNPYAHTHAIPLPSHPGEEDNEDLDALAARLLPLQHIESLLKAKLVPPNEEEAVDLGATYDAVSNGNGKGAGYVNGHSTASGMTKEIYVRPGRWRASFIRTVGSSSTTRHANGNGRLGGIGEEGADLDGEDDEAQAVLWECREDMIALWRSQRVREVLALRRVRLEDESGFFLNDLERVTEVGYLPTDGAFLSLLCPLPRSCSVLHVDSGTLGRGTDFDLRCMLGVGGACR